MMRNENHCSHHRRPKSTLGVFYVNWLSQATVETLYEKYWGLRTLNIIILTNFSIRQLKNRKNRWIHTKKHRNTSKVSLLCLFYRNIRIIIFSFRRPQYSYKKSHRGGSRRLKIPRSVIERISRGNTFQSAGAATWNDLSPNVTLLL